MTHAGQEGLIRDALDGEQEAFAELARQHRPRIVMLAARLLGDAHEAEDAVQEALAAAFTKLRQLSDPAKFAPWLNVIVINECRRRRRQGQPLSLAMPDVADASGAARSPQGDLGSLLAAAAARILALPARQSLAATWFYFNGASYAEIAAMLETSSAAVQSLLQRARRRLRDLSHEILRDGERIMEDAASELELVVSTPELLIEKLSLGNPQWGVNRLSTGLVNRCGAKLYLTLDIRSCLPGQRGGWERGFFYELGAGEQRRIGEDYHLRHILSPWYALFRGAFVSQVRVTFALLSEQEFCPDEEGRRTTFHDVPQKVLFQRWFDVVIPADGHDRGLPVKPILPQPGDVTLEDAALPSVAPGQHELVLKLRNCTSESRWVYVHVDTPGWGSGAERALPPRCLSELRCPYVIHKGWQDGVGHGASNRVLVTVLQLPLNFDELDIGDERFFCRWAYQNCVAEASVARKEFALSG